MNNTKIEKMEKNALLEKIVVYVPSTRFDVPLQAHEKERLDRFVMSTLSSIFGGVTMIPAHGAYISDGGKLIIENITQAHCFSAQLDNVQVDKVLDMVDFVKSEYEQESMAMEINGKLHFL